MCFRWKKVRANGKQRATEHDDVFSTFGWLTREILENQTLHLNKFISRFLICLITNFFLFDFSVYVGEGLSWEWRQLFRGMSFSLTWRVEMRWRQLMWRSSWEISSTSRVLSLCFFCVPFPLRRDAFVSHSPRGLSAKKHLHVVSRSAFCTFRWYLIINESLEMDTNGSEWKKRRKKFFIFLCWKEI